MKPCRIIELSHRLVPGEEEFVLEIQNFNVEEVIERIERREDIWYILQEIKMSSHVGTHIEFPYHHLKTGKSASDYPILRTMGETALLDFSHKKKDEVITREEIKACGVEMSKDDIVFIRTDMHKLWKTPRGHDRPVLAVDAADYLVNTIGIKCIGTDATGLEVRGRDDQPVHMVLFEGDVAMVESLTNLDKLSQSRFISFILPLAVKGLDSCPVRILAFEDFEFEVPDEIIC